MTVGTELAALTGFKLIHNHLSVNMVRSVFGFQSPPYERMVQLVRREMFAEAAREGVDLVFTGAYRPTGRIEPVREMVEPVRAHGGSVLFVQLVCEEKELLARVQIETRKSFGKMTDPERLADRLMQHEMQASFPFEPHLRIDNTHLAPAAAAAKIADHFSLPRVTGG